jgi:hypothetical protein
MMRNLRASYGQMLGERDDNAVLVPFCLEANGTAGQVLTGIRPHVQIRALHPVVDGYDGNVYVRKLFAGLELEKTREFMMAHLGRPYEGFRTFLDLARAPISANLVEDTSRLFCSEMAALLYRTYCGIDIPNVSNVIPESLGSGAGRYDLLQLIADVEIPLKLQYVFPSTDPDCCCCWAGPKSGRCVLM